jgi:hypothetical protein
MWHCSGQQPWMSRSCCLVTKSSVMGPQRSRHRDRALLQPAISIHTTTLDQFKPMSSVTSVTKPATTKRFSPVEIADRHKNGRCFHCDKFFTQWHKIVGKHMFVIEVLNEPDEAMPVEKIGDPTISIHALTSILPRSEKMMQLHVMMQGRCLVALLDTGSTHNFIDTATAE